MEKYTKRHSVSTLPRVVCLKCRQPLKQQIIANRMLITHCQNCGFKSLTTL